VFSTYRLALFERLANSPDAVLAAVAAKGMKELTYHRDFAGRWFLTLAQGTEESRQRIMRGLEQVWPLTSELFETHEAEAGVGVDPSTLADEVDVILEQVFAMSGVPRPEVLPLAGVRSRKGRDGLHTEAMSLLLTEMQVVARAHPMGRW
jgi:ring-1,2-phenylacetyl-CoA epoxidase subunit PaaC